MISGVKIDKSELEAFCLRWQIIELSLFGSVLREDFTKQSDIDILVQFAPTASWTLIDLAEMKESLEVIIGNRTVDLVTKRSIENSRNPYRKKEILTSAKVIYGKAG